MPRMDITEMAFARVYPLLVTKAEKKGRTRDEVDQVTAWLTGYTPEELAGLALSLALRSYADQLACQRILDLIAPQEATKAERKRRVKEG